jgi:putative ABC transport system substrate-binding protein
MKRREFVTLLGSAATWPFAALAQPSNMPVVGFLSTRAPEESADLVEAFRSGLKERGFVDGQNAKIEFRWAHGDYGHLPALAAELVRAQVAVIATLGGDPSALAAKAATSTIPIVFAVGSDPVKEGLVESFNRPGGNLTGVATLSSAVMAKRLELLREITPRAEVFAALINPKNPAAAISAKEVQDAARALAKDIHIVHASNESELESAFATLSQLRTGALLITPDGLFIIHAARVAALSIKHAIPASHERRAFPDAGGLMSDGSSQADGMRLAGFYAGRVLKGEKPADMPVMQPTKFELVINLKTAKAFGLTVPPSLLALADEVIE